MADGSLTVQRRDFAISAVDEWLFDYAGGVRRLDQAERRHYLAMPRFETSRASGRLDGWRVPVETGLATVEFDIVCDAHFPWGKAEVYAVDKSVVGVIPHIEKDGNVCVVGGQAEVAFDNPIGAVRNLLAAASDLYSANSEGANPEEFRNEFTSYWPGVRDGRLLQSLINPAGPSRLIRVWNGVSRRVICETGEDDRALQWLDNLLGKLKPVDRKLDDAVLLWLDNALIPAEFPNSAAELLAIAASKTQSGEALLRQAVSGLASSLLVVLGADTLNGPALAAVLLRRPQHEGRGPGRAKVDPLAKGFRPGNIPEARQQAALLGNLPIVKLDVARVDHEWVHGRGTDERQKILQSAKVTMVGCGSIGSEIAIKLAEAGVGNLDLIDPQILLSANVGRHALGASAVGHFKALRLAERLRRDFPHIRQVSGYASTWQEAFDKKPELLTNCDLVISTIGSWGQEGRLNELHITTGRQAMALYGWTEPHALAGHAVLIRRDACLACGLNSVGVPKRRVTEWPLGNTTMQEPACGAVYQPYGPVELLYTIATITNHALDALLGRGSTSAARVWCADLARVEEAGGRWTAEWTKIADNRNGDFVETMPWPVRDNCPFCRGRT